MREFVMPILRRRFPQSKTDYAKRLCNRSLYCRTLSIVSFAQQVPTCHLLGTDPAESSRARYDLHTYGNCSHQLV